MEPHDILISKVKQMVAKEISGHLHQQRRSKTWKFNRGYIKNHDVLQQNVIKTRLCKIRNNIEQWRGNQHVYLFRMQNKWNRKLLKNIKKRKKSFSSNNKVVKEEGHKETSKRRKTFRNPLNCVASHPHYVLKNLLCTANFMGVRLPTEKLREDKDTVVSFTWEGERMPRCNCIVQSCCCSSNDRRDYVPRDTPGLAYPAADLLLHMKETKDHMTAGTDLRMCVPYMCRPDWLIHYDIRNQAPGMSPGVVPRKKGEEAGDADGGGWFSNLFRRKRDDDTDSVSKPGVKKKAAAPVIIDDTDLEMDPCDFDEINVYIKKQLGLPYPVDASVQTEIEKQEAKEVEGTVMYPTPGVRARGSVLFRHVIHGTELSVALKSDPQRGFASEGGVRARSDSTHSGGALLSPPDPNCTCTVKDHDRLPGPGGLVKSFVRSFLDRIPGFKGVTKYARRDEIPVVSKAEEVTTDEDYEVTTPTQQSNICPFCTVGEKDSIEIAPASKCPQHCGCRVDLAHYDDTCLKVPHDKTDRPAKQETQDSSASDTTEQQDEEQHELIRKSIDTIVKKNVTSEMKKAVGEDEDTTDFNWADLFKAAEDTCKGCKTCHELGGVRVADKKCACAPCPIKTKLGIESEASNKPANVAELHPTLQNN